MAGCLNPRTIVKQSYYIKGRIVDQINTTPTYLRYRILEKVVGMGLP